MKKIGIIETYDPCFVPDCGCNCRISTNNYHFLDIFYTKFS